MKNKTRAYFIIRFRREISEFRARHLGACLRRQGERGISHDISSLSRWVSQLKLWDCSRIWGYETCSNKLFRRTATKSEAGSPRFSEAGFSLIELTVASAIFVIVMMTAGAVFVRAVTAQRQGFAMQRIQENLMTIMEQIGREIRISRIDNTMGTNTEGCGNTSITMEHPINGTVVYEYNDITKNICRYVEGSYDCSKGQLNSDDVSFNQFAFCLNGSLVDDDEPARVTLSVRIESSFGSTGDSKVLQAHVQTTIVSRDLVSEFQHP